MRPPATRPRWTELVRLGLLAAVAVWLLHPFAAGRQIGAGDALWYANMLADFVTQWRAGVFPVFAGQTDFAFNGAVYPLRVAPLYQHLAGVLDLVTGHKLGFFALQHLCVIVCGVAGLYGCYFALARIAPRHRWSAAVFAALYLSCPGLLGTVYTQDLYMTWMTVPFAPLAVYGIVRTYQRDDYAAQLWLAAPLAALWWGHSPIALWMTGLAAVTQAARLVLLNRNAASWRRACVGVAAFALLAQYPFVSVHFIQAPGSASAVSASLASPEDIAKNVRSAFPAMLLPVTTGAAALGDLQLGYALWAALLVAILASFALPKCPERLALRLLLACSAVLLLLLLPVPWVTDQAWAHMPGTIKRITYYWPMQRFYLILAALVAFAGQLALSAWRPGFRRQSVIVAGLCVACIWSLYEARKFIQAGQARTASATATTSAQRPENLLLMNHSYGLFAGLPPYFSNGVMDPRAEVRLWTDKAGLVGLGAAPHAPGAPMSASTAGWASPHSGRFRGKIDPNPGILDLAPTFRLEPGRAYELVLEFANHDYRGVLQIAGRSMFREYLLPASGEPLAFGAGPANSHALPLWTTDPAGDEIALRFIPTAPGAHPADFADFAQFTLRKIDLGRSPVEITSLMPFRATVRADAPGWLETPRMFMPGYVATEDGLPVEARPSPAGLVMIPVGPATHAVELRFVGPTLLRISYWAAMTAWTALLMLAGLRLAQKRYARESP